MTERGLVRIHTNPDTGKQYAVLVDKDGNERNRRSPHRSPEGTQAEAEQYADNYRRFGAWLKS